MEKVLAEVEEMHFIELLSIPSFTDELLEFLIAWLMKRSSVILDEQYLYKLLEQSLSYQFLLRKFEVRLVQQTLNKLQIERKHFMLLEEQKKIGMQDSAYDEFDENEV